MDPRITIQRHSRTRAKVEEAIRQQHSGQNVVFVALEPESLPPWARKALKQAGVKVVFSKQRKTDGK